MNNEIRPISSCDSLRLFAAKRMFSVNSVALWFHFEKLAALILGGVFLYAGAVKMSDPLRFADSIASFKILPMILINPLALSLPPLEVFTGLMLVVTVVGQAASLAVGRHMATGPVALQLQRCICRVGTFSVIILCLIFCLVILSALLRGINVDCGCFGSGTPSILKTWLALGRDILLLATAAVIYRLELRKECAYNFNQ